MKMGTRVPSFPCTAFEPCWQSARPSFAPRTIRGIGYPVGICVAVQNQWLEDVQ